MENDLGVILLFRRAYDRIRVREYEALFEGRITEEQFESRVQAAHDVVEFLLKMKGGNA